MKQQQASLSTLIPALQPQPIQVIGLEVIHSLKFTSLQVHSAPMKVGKRYYPLIVLTVALIYYFNIIVVTLQGVWIVLHGTFGHLY